MQKGSCVVEEVKTKVEQGSSDGATINDEVRLGQMPTARSNEESRPLLVCSLVQNWFLRDFHQIHLRLDRI